MMFSYTKIAVVFILLFLMAGLLYLATKDQRIINWNIHFKKIDPHGIYGRPEDTKFFYHLRRADNEKRQSVACVEGKTDGRILLNPRHKFGNHFLDYGPIPELSQFNIQLANTLYGAPVSSKNIGENIKENSYKLLVYSAENHDGQEFIIDFRFEKSILKQYRVRSNSGTSNWNKV